jgi:hypothetical protein
MRWDNLFHDLEAQLETESEAAQADIARDERRRQRADETLWYALLGRWEDRVRGHNVEVWTDLGCLWIAVDNFGDDWLAGEVLNPPAERGYVVLNSCAVRGVRVSVTELDRYARDIRHDCDDSVRRPMGRRPGVVSFRIVLRDLARRRKAGWLCTPLFAEYGRINRVGRDFVEMHVLSRPGIGEKTPQLQAILVPLATTTYFRLDD